MTFPLRLSAGLLGLAMCATLTAQASAAPAPKARAALAGVWGSRNKSIPEGVAAGYPINLGATDWLPLSAGRPEDMKIDSYELQQTTIEKVINSGGDVFAYMASRAPRPPYTADGQKAVAAARAAQPDPSKRSPYDRCLPRNTTGAFGGGAGGLIEVFDGGDHLGVITEAGAYTMIRLGAVDASKFAPTYAGTSVGRWDGDRLVITTTNYLGAAINGWQASPQAKVVETVWVSPDRMTLNIKTVYEDPANLSEPMARMVYRDRAGKDPEFLPNNCVEDVQGAAEYAATFGATPP